MSWTKCDCHGQRSLGKASGAYPAVVNGDRRDSKRLKLCPNGLSDLLGAASKYLYSATAELTDEVDVFTACGWCGQERGVTGGAAVFLTVYKLGKERADFAGCACDAHVTDALRDMLLG